MFGIGIPEILILIIIVGIGIGIVKVFTEASNRDDQEKVTDDNKNNFIQEEKHQHADLKTDIQMLLFKSNAKSALCEHIIMDIEKLSPDRVLIVGGDKHYSEILIKKMQSLTDQYEILWNDSCSLKWLCQTVEKIRNEEKKAILLSNFPREVNPPTIRYLENGITSRAMTMPKGTSLRLCSASDKKTQIAVYVIFLHAIGYCRNVYLSQASGREEMTRFQILEDPHEDSSLLTSESKKLQECKNESECQEMLWEIATKLEHDPNTPPSAYGGGILLP